MLFITVLLLFINCTLGLARLSSLPPSLPAYKPAILIISFKAITHLQQDKNNKYINITMYRIGFKEFYSGIKYTQKDWLQLKV